MNPGSVFNPNIAASRGESETRSAGGKLTPPQGFINLTVEYAPPSQHLTYGFDVENIFNETFAGAHAQRPLSAACNGYQRTADRILDQRRQLHQLPVGMAAVRWFMNGNGVWVNIPSGLGRTFYFYIQARL